MKIYIITGQSGAGKTQALRCFEDMGFFCVDNLPPVLMPQLVSYLLKTSAKFNVEYKNVAIVVDVRAGELFRDLDEALETMTKEGMRYEIVFFYASDEVIIRRYKETRAKHPLQNNRTLIEAMAEETRQLRHIREMAEYEIDTSQYNQKQLSVVLNKMFGDTETQMNLSIVTFGYKYGVPADADMVLDVRFLPNPFYVEKLKRRTGMEQEVRDFVFASGKADAFLDKLVDMVCYLIPLYMQEDKYQLTIAVGCTGGMHRSVAIGESLFSRLKNAGYNPYMVHRDMKL
ncbi:MAG: RNase adapter RapZ [Christensenellales bacterium]